MAKRIDLDEYADPLDDPDEGVALFHLPETLLDSEDPQNDRYFKHLRSLEARMLVASRALRPKQVQVAKLHHRGRSQVDIAREVGYAQSRVNTLLRKDPKVQTLLDLLQQYDAALEGPNLALRKNMLWRIAARNELADPNITISAVRELNKMSGDIQAAQLQAPSQVTIVINQDQLPKTALDLTVEPS